METSKKNSCIQCGKKCAITFCREHWLEKEAVYGLWDLTASDKEWNGGQNAGRQDFKDRGVERLIAYTRYMLKLSGERYRKWEKENGL